MNGEAGEHGDLIQKREHQRTVFQTSETPDEQQQKEAQDVMSRLAAFSPRIDAATASWYKFENLDIPVVVRDRGEQRVENLSQHSSLVRGLTSVNQVRVYVPLKYRDEAKELIAKKPNAEP